MKDLVAWAVGISPEGASFAKCTRLKNLLLSFFVSCMHVAINMLEISICDSQGNEVYRVSDVFWMQIGLVCELLCLRNWKTLIVLFGTYFSFGISTIRKARRITYFAFFQDTSIIVNCTIAVHIPSVRGQNNIKLKPHTLHKAWSSL